MGYDAVKHGDEYSILNRTALVIKSNDEKFSLNSQKPLTAQAPEDRMNGDETSSDGGLGSGRYPKWSGKKCKR